MARKIELGKLKLSWHARNGQWRKSIGYKPDKAGLRRVPAEFYFGADEAAAFMAAQAKLEEWRELVGRWEEEKEGAQQVFPEMDLSEPFWWVTGAVLEAAETVDQVAASRPENVTVEKAKGWYIDAMRARLGLMGVKGLKQSTFNHIVANLDRALTSTDPKTNALVLPPGKFIHLITHTDVAAVINCHYKKAGVAERTALNYCRAFQAFLEWMDNQPQLRFQRPKGMDALFKLGKPAADPRVPTFDEIKAIYAACRTDDERLFVLLGINCGMYEVDISDLTPAALVTYPGGIWWRRSKTSHQNAFYVWHWLFPETSALITTQRAAENPHGRLFLNKLGAPLSESKDGHRTKAVSEAFERVILRAGLKGKGISFKSLRKFGAHELRAQAAGDKDNLARKYLGQAVPGVLRHYVRDDFEDLAAELKRFRQRLVAAGVLPQSASC